VSRFFFFGPPQSLHSDNGREFVSVVITELKTLFPDLVFIRGRPRHPQSQGCVERANGIRVMPSANRYALMILLVGLLLYYLFYMELTPEWLLLLHFTIEKIRNSIKANININCKSLFTF
jgi:hypothetical protein